MIDGLKPYPAYQDSGVRWLGEIPTHWEVTPIGRIGTLMKGSGGTKADDSISGVPCIRYGDLYTRHEFFIRSTRSFVTQERSAEYTPVSYGDVLFAGSGETIEEIGKSAVSLITSRACCGGDVLLLRPTHEVVPGFLGYASDCDSSVHQKAIMGRGVTVMHIYADRLKYLWLPFPPLPEQAAIVRFLDHADWRIRRYIAAKKKLIALLNEQKQAMVDSAVTLGVPRCERFQLLGSAPPARVNAAWETARLWAVAQIRSEKKRPDLGLLSVFLGRGVILYGEGGGQVHKPSLDLAEYQVVHTGDLVLNNQQAWRGSVGVSSHYGIISPAYVVLRLDGSLDPRYASYLFSSRSMVAQFVTSSKGVGDIQRDVHIPWLKNVRIPIPPREDQATIVEHLDRRLADLEHHALRSEREIVLVQEYRTRLIADVVTGKLDVRDAAVRLPDEVEEPEPLDAEALVGGDESEDEVDLDGAAREVDG